MSRRASWMVMAGAVALLLVWVSFAPAERTLGSGIRSVYLHVAASWSGLAGVYLAGLLGMVLAWRPTAGLERWTRSVASIGIALFIVGFGLSLWSARVNWGGILLGEARVAASFWIVVAGLFVRALTATAMPRRWKGLSWTLLAAFAAWSLSTAELFFHPERPFRSSEAMGIVLGLYGALALTLVAGAMGVLLLATARPVEPEDQRE